MENLTKTKEVCVSLKSLYETGKELSDTAIFIQKDTDGELEWFDLHSRFGGILCMDGEVCEIVSIDNGLVTLLNKDGEEENEFTLNIEEFEMATYKKLSDVIHD